MRNFKGWLLASALLAVACPAIAGSMTLLGAGGVAGGGGPPPPQLWAQVQNAALFNYTGTTATATLAAPVTSGNLLFICVGQSSPTTQATSFAITDDKGGNTYTPIGPLHNGGIGFSAQMFLSGVITNGPSVFTVTHTGGSGAGQNAIAVVEYSGLTIGVDTAFGGGYLTGNYSGTGGADVLVSNSFAPGAVNDLIAACIVSTDIATAGTGFILRANNNQTQSEDKAATGAVSQTATFSTAHTMVYELGVVVLR